MDIQYDKVCALLTDTIMLMCKNGIQFRNELKVQGLIGLTVDKHVFIIQINEMVKTEEQCPKKLQVIPEPSFQETNMGSADNDSTQDNGAIDYYYSAFSYGEKPQEIENNVSMKTKQPVEMRKKMQRDFNVEDLNLTSHLASSEVLSEEIDQKNITDLDVLQSDHSAFDSHLIFNEQNAPINLRIHSRLEVVESDKRIDEPPDIKPLTGELEEWIVNNAVPPISNGKPSYKKKHETKRSEVLNLKTNSRSYDASTSSNFLLQSPSTRFNEKKRLVCDVDYSYCEVSKFSCNLCPAAYKHYCNLLTHEVKVHGRQKKKGGRRKKLL